MANPKATVRYPSLRARIMANVSYADAPAWANVEGPCWIWQCAKNARGYGRIQVRKPERKKPYTFGILVHRLVLEVFCGIPLREIDTANHLCSNKPCCNPEHIDAGTALENRDYYYNVERFKRAEADPPLWMLRMSGAYEFR